MRAQTTRDSNPASALSSFCILENALPSQNQFSLPFLGFSGVEGLAAASVEESSKADNSDDNEDVDDDDETLKDPADPTAAVPPSAAVAKKWKELLKIPKVITSTKATRFGPSIKKPLKKWADVETATDFSALRGEDCLHGAFEVVRKKNDHHIKLASFAANASGAAAHATLSAYTAMEGVFDELKDAFAHDQNWTDWLTQTKEKVKSSVLSPLQDAASCCAATYGLASWQVRQAVIKEADKSIQSILRSKPPSNGFYFGDPVDAIHAQMSYAYMSSAVRAKPTSSRARPAFQSRAYAPKKKPPPPPSSASSSSSKPSGNSGGRSFRGGKGGRKQ